jgi:23S rRNA (guanine2445-N2)-methyltransferase / 23S rRNA (guanine2069-N7)-methyltransferase
VTSQEDLYAGIYKVNWFDHMKPDDSFAVSFNAKASKVINNTHFGALKVKDAVVDQMRKKFNKRPEIHCFRTGCKKTRVGHVILIKVEKKGELK